jgi:hypothetical protein
MENELFMEELEAAGEMLDQLGTRTFYANHEKALNELFGLNLFRRVHIPVREEKQ